MEIKELIKIEELDKIDLRVGKIVEAERIEGSDKLLKLQIDLGEEKRQILAGIGKAYIPEELINKSVVVIINLESRMMMGLESQGMVLAVKDSNNLSILSPDKEIISGSKLS
ncbi:MAG: methionine--tRNA ligase subunit beta [Minisyncoccales bacterium]